MAKTDGELQRPYLQITISTEEEVTLGVRELSAFLYDIHRLYVICRLTFDPSYSGHIVSNKGYRVRPADKLLLISIRHESPLLLVVAVPLIAGAIGAIWGLLQIGNFFQEQPLKMRKLHAELEKVERENYNARRDIYLNSNSQQARDAVTNRGAIKSTDAILQRLEQSPINIESIELQAVGVDTQTDKT